MNESNEAVLYHEDGSISYVLPANGNHFTIRELQGMVNGRIRLVPFGERLLIGNENAKTDGCNLPNLAATVQWMKVYGSTDVLYGPVLISPSEYIS